ncbi:MAG: hypothetical protein M0Z59_06430 [Nitrospiraceae bacterium]|nr:hypothetical protein [Nitrospiraceae bacterium]
MNRRISAPAIKRASAGFQERAASQSRPMLAAEGLALVLVIGIVDYLTGYHVHVTLFYLVPVCFSAWFMGGGAGTLFSMLSVFSIILADKISGKIYLDLPVEGWNALVHLGFFATVSLLVSKLKQNFAEREELVCSLQEALDEVKKLSGFLPICSHCKKIRDDMGYWTQLEKYISERSEAQFTHGICPDCLKKLYPDVHIEHIKECGPEAAKKPAGKP